MTLPDYSASKQELMQNKLYHSPWCFFLCFVFFLTETTCKFDVDPCAGLIWSLECAKLNNCNKIFTVKFIIELKVYNNKFNNIHIKYSVFKCRNVSKIINFTIPFQHSIISFLKDNMSKWNYYWCHLIANFIDSN